MVEAIDFYEKTVRIESLKALAYAEDISKALEPYKRYVFTWIRWRLKSQPKHILEAVEASMSGDPRPLAHIGMVIRRG